MSLLRTVFIVLTTLTLLACEGSDSSSDSDTAENSTPSGPDTDGDGLTDAIETSFYFTSPDLADTDGDGISDGDEVNEFGFNPAANRFRFNPLIADLPSIKINIETIPELVLNYTDSTGSETSVSNASGGESVDSFTHSITEGIEAGMAFEVDGSIIPPPKAKVTKSFNVSFEASQEWSTENHRTWETVTENSSSTGRETDGATIRVGVSLENNSNLSFSLEHITLVSSFFDQESNLRPIATLGFDTGGNGFQRTSFSPGELSPTLLFDFGDLDLGTALEVLKDARSLTVEPALFELTNEEGTPFDFDLGDINAKSADVLIDYGVVRPQEFYNISALGSLNNGFLTIDNILADVLNASYSNSGGITDIRGVGGDPLSRWVIVFTQNDGFIDQTIVYDPENASYDTNLISIFPGNKISFIYLTDVDGDGVGIREEVIHGTSPNSADTDGDGLTDEQEIRGLLLVNSVNLIDPDRYPAFVRSNPVLADADGDGLFDLAERDRGLDPNNADTDGDGINDFLDNFNGQLPIAVDFELQQVDSVNRINLSGIATPGEGSRVSNVTVDWGDLSTPDIFSSVSSAPLAVDIDHDYAAPTGSQTYTITITVSGEDPDMNAISFTYIGDVTVFEETNLNEFAAGWFEHMHLREVADVDGDNDLDLVGFGGSNVLVSTWNGTDPDSADGDAFNTPLEIWSNDFSIDDGYTDKAQHIRKLADYDGDGLLDIVGFSNAGVEWSRNNGSGFDAPSFIVANFNTNFNTEQHLRTLGDIDCNGLPDIIGMWIDGTYVYLNDSASTPGSVYRASPSWGVNGGWVNDTTYRFVSDINNDGCDDIIGFGNTQMFYTLGQPNGMFQPAVVFRTFPQSSITANGGWRPNLHPVLIDDVNDDDLPDIVGFGNNGVHVWLNESSGSNVAFADATTWSTNFDRDSGWRWNERIFVNNVETEDTDNINPRYLADVNGDGYKDVVGFGNGHVFYELNRQPKGQQRFGPQFGVLTNSIVVSANWLDADYNQPCGGGGFGSPFNQPPCDSVYNSRYAADVDGDGHADAIGFGNSGVVLQRTPVITQPVEQ